MSYRVSFLVLVITLLFFGGTGPAKVDGFVATFGNWHVQTYKEGSGKVCLIWSQPEKSEGNYTRRGGVYAYVTQRPAKKRLNEISISMGYPLKKGSKLRVLIGKAGFEMFSSADMGWSHSKDDTKLVKAMRAGSVMTVRGVSRRGTKTKDTFSLKGFTKAYLVMNRSCKISKKRR